MCGIVGFLAKDTGLYSSLGAMLEPMLIGMTERGPDSAGFALFGNGADTGGMRINLAAPANFNWDDVASAGKIASLNFQLDGCARHAVLETNDQPDQVIEWLSKNFGTISVMSVGHSMDIYKDVGMPAAVAQRYGLVSKGGSHGIGHTRMATESGITLQHAHPFVAGEDFCIVHNGSLSNPYSIRRKLEHEGIMFESDNDTEAAARFIQWRLREGDDLNKALELVLKEVDGFYTLLMANAQGMALVRDTFACKPAVVAETDDYVAVASEYRSLKMLPGIEDAKIFEPGPDEIHIWETR